MICRICDSIRLELAIDLGLQPWCNNFLLESEVGKEPLYPLRLVYCHDCSTVQLDYTVDKKIMFSHHTYLSGMTQSLSNHFKSVAEEVDTRFFSQASRKSVLDIGSNDGTQLKHFKALGYDVLGVESSKGTALIANDVGIETINEFFNLDLSQQLSMQFDIINAAGVFFHLEELHSVAEGIRVALKRDGVFIVQFLYMRRIVENLAFDQIYHEHLLYYNLHTIEILLNRHGMSIFDAYLSPIHGGSIVAYVSHSKQRRRPSARLRDMREQEVTCGSNEFKTYLDFGERIKKSKNDNLGYLARVKNEGKTVYGMGAPVKGNTLLNYYGIDTRYIDCLVEINELRRGLYSPGMHIPIVIEKELATPPDVYYVLAWNFKDEILAKNKKNIENGVEFYFPVNPKAV